MKNYTSRFSIILIVLIALSSYKVLYGQTVIDKVASDTLPAPFETKSAKNFSKVIGWGDHAPVAPKGFMITKFADSLQHPRWIYVADNGDIFIAESNTI